MSYAQVLTNEECKEKYAEFDNVVIRDSKLCALDPFEKKDACQGD